MATDSRIPRTASALIVRQGKSGYKFDAVLEDKELPSSLEKGQLLLKIGAVAFNHRDLWIRKGLYPGIIEGATLGSDGVGEVIAAGDPNEPLLGKRVFLSPQHGWRDHPHHPESPSYGVIGGVKNPSIGTFASYVVVPTNEVIEAPEHLTDEQVAAWPLAAVTAWRASVVHAKAQSGSNILITGIGGGVALTALQLCFGKGANVFVTSGTQEKIDEAKKLGAKGGAIYKEKDWAKKIAEQCTGKIDAVIDSAGGDVLTQISKFMKPAAPLVCYGMTAEPKITFTMREVLAQQKIIGSTMGSYKDLQDATAFIAEKKIVPIVSSVIDGLENAEQGFEMMSKGSQFGKIVIKVGGRRSANL